jgi:protein-disulfide isomerase
MAPKRAAMATAGLALTGVALSLIIVSIHRNLAANAGYTSFCNVNETVNCDVVLSSKYAYFAGIPVAWWAVLTYLLVAGAALFYLRATDTVRRRQLASGLVAVSSGSVLYSLYLAFIALAVLNSVCLLCGSLYLVNAGLLVSTWLLFAGTRLSGRAKRRAARGWQRPTAMMTGAAAVMVLAFVAAALWKTTAQPERVRSASEVARQDPEFYKWYLAQPVSDLSIDGGHRKGGAGDVVIVEFSDFQCGHCAKAFRDLRGILLRFERNVQVVFRHFPLNKACNSAINTEGHEFACLAAIASECAAKQDRFWAYHDTLFENQSALDRSRLISYATQIGLDRETFVACLESDEARLAVQRDVRAAVQLGVTSTPTFFINGRRVAGTLGEDRFKYAILLEREARRAKQES